MADNPLLLFGALGVVGLGLGLLAVAGSSEPTASPASGGASTADSRDVEALARMIASENPRGSLTLWVEQCWSQIHSLRRGQSLHARITANRGYGPQDKHRPVSTVEEASPLHRAVARLVLLGSHAATWVRARKFFEPEQQDAMFKLAEASRLKRSRGEQLTARELRSLGYEKDADAIRREWAGEGSRRLGVIDGVEFWT